MDYNNLSSLRTAAGLDNIETLPTANIDADLAQLSKLSGMSIEQYYLMKPKEKTFPAIDLRIDPLVSYNNRPIAKDEPPSCDMGKLADLLRSSFTVEPINDVTNQNNIANTQNPISKPNISGCTVATPSQLEFILQQLEVCYGTSRPDMEDPVVYTIIQDALELENIPDYQMVVSVFDTLYPKQPVPVIDEPEDPVPDVQPIQPIVSDTEELESDESEELEESAVIVPEIETEAGGIRYSTLVDESGDVSILDSKKGITNIFSGLQAAEIKSQITSISGSKLQVYLSQFFTDDDDSTITEEISGFVSSDNWADEAVQVAEYLAELISEMEGTTLIDTFLIGQLSNFIKRHGFK